MTITFFSKNKTNKTETMEGNSMITTFFKSKLIKKVALVCSAFIMAATPVMAETTVSDNNMDTRDEIDELMDLSDIEDEIDMEEEYELVPEYASYTVSDIDWRSCGSKYIYNNKLSKEERILWDRLDAVCYKYLTTTATPTVYNGTYHTDIVHYYDLGISDDNAVMVTIMFINSNPQYYFINVDPSGGSSDAVTIAFYDEFVNGNTRMAVTNQLAQKLGEYQYLVQKHELTTEYDKIRLAAMKIKCETTYERYMHWASAIGALVEGKAVCGGYAAGYALLANYLGLDAFQIHSNSHVFVAVRIDGNWFYSDALNRCSINRQEAIANEYNPKKVWMRQVGYSRNGILACGNIYEPVVWRFQGFLPICDYKMEAATETTYRLVYEPTVDTKIVDYIRNTSTVKYTKKDYETACLDRYKQYTAYGEKESDYAVAKAAGLLNDNGNNNDNSSSNNQNSGYDNTQNNVQSNRPQNMDINSGVGGFVARMYTCVLSRAYDDGGLNYWVNELASQNSDGASLARGFVCSKEFKNRNVSDGEYLDILYQTFFDRYADSDGKLYWLYELNKGMSREQVLAGFVNSKEFAIICDSYGIARGTMEADGTNINNPGVRGFVRRNYEKVLGRNGETEGIEYWSHLINTQQVSAADTAKNFFHSKEFLQKNTSNDAYIEVLYQTFMGRASDANGKAYWLNMLSSGRINRDGVLEQFAVSQEFNNIMRSYGI